MTNCDLKILFKKLNKKYFNNKLDPSIEVSFRKITVLGLTKRIWFTRLATTKERRYDGLNKADVVCYYCPRIFISNKMRFSPRLCVQTLLHEMVHAEYDNKTTCGPNWNKFNRRMLELAKLGAFNGWW